MITLFIALLNFGTFTIANKVSVIDMKGEYNLSPDTIISGKNSYYFVNDNTGKVICFDLNGMKYQVSGKGQGPGEYEGLIAIAYSNGRFYIFQHSKSLLMEHDNHGKMLRTIKLQQDNQSAFLSCELLVYEGHFYLINALHDEWVSKFDQNGALVQVYTKKLPNLYGRKGHPYIAVSARDKTLTIFSRFTGDLMKLDLQKGLTSLLSSIHDPLNSEGLALYAKSSENSSNLRVSISTRFSTILNFNHTKLSAYYEVGYPKKVKPLFEIMTCKRHYLDTSNLLFDVAALYQVDEVLFLLSTDGDLYWLKSHAVQLK